MVSHCDGLVGFVQAEVWHERCADAGLGQPPAAFCGRIDTACNTLMPRRLGIVALTDHLIYQRCSPDQYRHHAQALELEVWPLSQFASKLTAVVLMAADRVLLAELGVTMLLRQQPCLRAFETRQNGAMTCCFLLKCTCMSQVANTEQVEAHFHVAREEGEGDFTTTAITKPLYGQIKCALAASRCPCWPNSASWHAKTWLAWLLACKGVDVQQSQSTCSPARIRHLCSRHAEGGILRASAAPLSWQLS